MGGGACPHSILPSLQAGLTSDGSGLSHNKPSVLSYLSNEFQRPAAVPAPEDQSSLPDDAAPSQEDAPRAPSMPNGVGSPLELYSTLASALVNLAFCEPFTVPAQGLQCGLRVWAPSMTEPQVMSRHESPSAPLVMRFCICFQGMFVELSYLVAWLVATGSCDRARTGRFASMTVLYRLQAAPKA